MREVGSLTLRSFHFAPHPLLGYASRMLQVERFLREARIRSNRHHPGIVQLLEMGQTGELHTSRWSTWLAIEQPGLPGFVRVSGTRPAVYGG